MDYRIPWPYFLFLLLVYSTVSIAALSFPLVVWGRLLLGLLVVSQWALLARHVALLRRITKLNLGEADNSAALDGETHLAADYRKPFVLSWLVILYWRFAGKRWAIPVFEKSMGTDNFRKLRVSLLMNR